MARKLMTLIIVAGLALTGCAEPAQPEAGAHPGADWAWADNPESMGWSSDRLAVAQAYAERIGSAAVMIVDDGVVIDAWGDLAHKYQCHSMRKSLISALYGIYVADGKIDLAATLEELGIDDRTPLTDVEKTATVAQLLSARSGVYIEAAGEAAAMKAIRPERGSHEPGTFWYYNNWDFNALGTIFDQLSDEENIYTAFDKRIASPIGMQDYVPDELHYFYEPYSRHPYYGFRMSTRDLARFGLLFLRDGRWGEQQVVPADWVRESTASHSVIGPQSGYGYMWWVGAGAGGFPNVDEGPGSYYASGYGGHNVIVMPARKLVVVHRVDTDAGHMVDETSIGTLLWMILDAAGEAGIGDPPLLERAVGTRLTADTLPQTLQRSTLRVMQPGAEIIATYGPDQTLSVALNGAPLTQGRWWVEGDHYCHDLGPEYGGPECGQLVLNGTQLRWFDLDGYLAMTFEYGQPAAPAPAPAAPTADSAKAAEYLDVFETVWQTVNDTFPDPTFGGADWEALRDQYEPLILAAEGDEEFFLTLNHMLWELNASHLFVIPNRPMSYLALAGAEGGVGIDVRMIDGEAVITGVKESSPADQAGLRPGYTLRSVGGATIQQIEEADKGFWMPPYSERARLGSLASGVLLRTYGPPGKLVTVVYEDDQGEYSVDLVRTQREGKSVLVEGVPPSFLEVESSLMGQDIGYVRFNAFDPALLDRLLAAVDEQSDASGLILDLRGNGGGFFEVRKALLERLVRERVLFCSQEGRRGTDEIYLDPSPQGYGGPIVVLVDELSASSSEEVAGGLQAIGRATIVGNRTPGKVLIGEFAQLSTGTFVYPVAITRLADGTILEGRGVIPDVEVALDRTLLLQGVDSQLEAAIEVIKRQASE